MFVLSAGLSVGLLETSVHFGRMAEATEMPFGVVGWDGLGKNVLNGGISLNLPMERGNFRVS